MRRFWAIQAVFYSLVSVLWAQRASPKDGFFSVEGPQGWSFTDAGNFLSWDETSSASNGTGQVTAGLFKQLSSSEARELFKMTGLTVTESEERAFHGIQCLYASGVNSSLNLKEEYYHCRVRRGNKHWSVIISCRVQKEYERQYSSTFDTFLDSFRWDKDIERDP